MLQSMTGFGRGEASDDDFNIVVEVKSVNHRFKDIRFKMSSLFNGVELDFKRELNSIFKRGSFDIYVNFKRNKESSSFDNIDEKKVSDFIQLMEDMTKNKDVSLVINPTEFLRSEFLLDNDLVRDTSLVQLTKNTFKEALKELSASRVSEGEKLLSIIHKHKCDFIDHLKKIEERTDEFQRSIEERLKKKFNEMADVMKIDEPRFLQEVVYYLEKMDIHEEINRIYSHLDKLDELLESDFEIGRKIDFLVQELNRETNTIASKSFIKEISDSAVQMKIQLEKMREQGLNLE